ncbi:uncharacterized protein LOC143230953 isoform X1 [Tachypleus tridentatus]|uniref:uncharacterized protein LOC143230953 isoform X1 n=1 Tax=Tachypleus tridentatus TaxID=6853 RepID=UPI003FD3757E
MGVISIIKNFLNTPKRKHVLAFSVENKAPKLKKSLKGFCTSWWVERHDSVIIFLGLIHAVADALETISGWKDRDSATQANQLLYSITQPEFIITLLTIAKSFSFSLPLCNLLQQQNIGLGAAMHHAEIVEDLIRSLRNNTVNEFNNIFCEAQTLCIELQIDIIMPRQAKRQMYRTNPQTTSPEEYFRIVVFVQFVDHFLSQICDRLSSHKTLLTNFMCLLPSGSTTERSKPTAQQCDQIKELVNIYKAGIDQHFASRSR